MPRGELRPDDAPAIRVEITDHRDLAALPAPIGVSPVAEVIPDERYSLTISPNGADLRARESVGVALGLTTLLQVLATTDETRPLGVVRGGDQARHVVRVVREVAVHLQH